jgi:methylmalonyl-CoA/ethylmalonyl-CoA epimerase
MSEIQPSGTAVSGIGQVAIPVDDVERATGFYRDVLGLPHLFSAPPGLSFFNCGDVRIMLSRPEEGGQAATSGGALLYYRVADVLGAHARLASGGAEVVAEPHVVHRSGGTELWIGFYRDSEGNLLGVMAENPEGGAD